MADNRYRPRSPPGSRRYHDPRASTGMFYGSGFEPTYSSQPRNNLDAYPQSRHSSIYDAPPPKRYSYRDDPHAGAPIPRTEYAVRPRTTSTLPGDGRRPLSMIGKNVSPTRNRPVVSNPSRDDPRNGASYTSRDDSTRYLVPATSQGREHHQRHYSATRADSERLIANARGDRARGQYHQSGGYNAAQPPSSRGPSVIKDDDFSYTGPREQFARDYPARPAKDTHSRRERPVSVMGLQDLRTSAPTNRRDMPPPPPPSAASRPSDRYDRLSIRPAPEPDMDRGGDIPSRRQSTRVPVVHQRRDDDYPSTRDDLDVRPAPKTRRFDRVDDDDLISYKPRKDRSADDGPPPVLRPRRARPEEDEIPPVHRPRREWPADDDDVVAVHRPRREKPEADDVAPMPKSRRERFEDDEPVSKPRVREDDRDRMRDREYHREPEREVRDRDRDNDYPREKERERERERPKPEDKSKHVDDRREVRSRDSSPEHHGASKGVVAGLGGIAVAGLAGAAVKSTHKSEDASDSETRKERRHRKHRHRDRAEDEQAVADTDPRERGAPPPPDDRAPDDRRLGPSRRDESASESFEDDHGRHRHRRHRHRDRDDASPLPPVDPVPAPVEAFRPGPDPEDEGPPRRRERATSRVREAPDDLDLRRTISPGEDEDARPRRVLLVEPEKKEAFIPRGILKAPRQVPFPEDPNPTREGVAPLKDAGKHGVPPGARWTKISRLLVNPEALEQAQERFEQRDDYVIVLRVVSREEIQKFAEKTKEIREIREREWKEDLKSKGQDPNTPRPYHHGPNDVSSDDEPQRQLDSRPAQPPLEMPLHQFTPGQGQGQPQLQPQLQGSGSGGGIGMSVPDIQLHEVDANYSNNV